MAGINLDAGINAKPFVRGVEDIIGTLEDLEDEVKQVQKDGDKSLEKLETSFAEIAKASQEAGNDVKKGLGKGTKDAVNEADEGLKDFKQEANSTAKESAASFDGSAESIVDAFQEVAANAFEGFGPAGTIAGLAAAAGIGIATAEFTKTQEEAQKAKERVNEFGLSIIENGEQIASLEQYQEALKLIVTNADDATVKIDDLETFTKKYGDRVPAIEDMAMAYAGNADAAESVTKQLENAIAAEEELQRTTKGGKGEAITASENRARAYQDQIDKLKQVQQETELAKQVEQDWLASGGAETLAKAAAVETINAAYDDVVNSVTDYVNAETGVLDVDAYLAAIDARTAKLAEYQASIAASNLTTEQKSALDAMGIDAAAAWMAGYEKTSPENKKKMEASLTEAAKESSGSAKKELDKAFQTPTEAKVQAKLDQESKQEVERALNKIAAQATLTVKVVDRNGRTYP